ncbi:hypothetical protein V8E54_008094 [Elaphomyces granulatus]
MTTVFEPFIFRGVIYDFKTCREVWKQYKRNNEKSDIIDYPLESQLIEAQRDIEKRWNRYVEPIGKQMAIGDGKISSCYVPDSSNAERYISADQAVVEIQNTRAEYIIKIEQLIKTHLEEPPRYSQDISAKNDDNQLPSQPPPAYSQEQLGFPEWQVTAAKLAQGAAKRIIKSLRELSLRLRPASGAIPHSLDSRPSLSPSSPPSPSLTDRRPNYPTPPPFCPGALLLQRDSSLRIDSIVLPTTSAPCFTCKFCYLELSSFQIFAMYWSSDDWTEVARCHVMACQSFKDKRAGYRCVACNVAGPNRTPLRTRTVGMFLHLSECQAIGENSEYSNETSVRELDGESE